MQISNNMLYLNNFDLTSSLRNRIRVVPILYNFLSTQYNKTKDNVILAPNNLQESEKTSYLRGFRLYLKSCSLDHIKLNDITESDIWYMAVVGYQYNNLTPLNYLRDYVITNLQGSNNQYSDTYYYLYLASNPYLFGLTMETELVRRQVYPSLRLIIQTRPKPPTLKLYLQPENLAIRTPQLKLDTVRQIVVKDTVVRSHLHNFNPININLKPIILEHGGVMGGDLSRLVYDSTVFSKLANLSRDILYKQEIVGSGGKNLYHILSYDLYELAQMLTYDNSKLDQVITNIRNSIPQSVKGVVNGVITDIIVTDKILLKNATSYKDLRINIRNYILDVYPVYLINDELYYKFDNLVYDINIYFHGEEALDQIQSFIIAFLLTSLTKIFHTKDKLILYHTSYGRTVRYVLYKRSYRDLSEILVSIDLDSQRCLYDGKQYIFTPSWLNSIEYGINVIVPGRLDLESNHNLLNAINNGFQPMLPLNGKNLTINNTGYTYSELVNKLDKVLNINLTIPFPDDFEPQELKNPSLDDIINVVNLDSKLKYNKNFVYHYDRTRDIMTRHYAIHAMITKLFIDESAKLTTDYIASKGQQLSYSQALKRQLLKFQGLVPDVVDLIEDYIQSQNPYQAAYLRVLETYRLDLAELSSA